MKRRSVRVLLVVLGLVSVSTTAHAICDFGPDTCTFGYVWREAFPGDHVCVLGTTRDAAAADNQLANQRRDPAGGPFGPDTCKLGFVWREASPTDHVCVTGATRAQAKADNALASSHRDARCVAPPLTNVPPCNGATPCFLTRKGPVSNSEAQTYYDTIDPPPGNKRSFPAWKAANGFGAAGGGGDVRAVYYQAGDLDIGRDMNCIRKFSPTAAQHAACVATAAACKVTSDACRAPCEDTRDACMASVAQPGGPRPAACVAELRQCLRGCPTCGTCPAPSVSRVACYVTNYGPVPGKPGHPDVATALEDAVANAQGQPKGAPFATVAMEYVPPGSAPNSVRFYVYDGAGGIQPSAQLDSEGQKSLPTMCMTCHGGLYSLATHSISGASFLPFDLAAFRFSQTAGFTSAAQEESFRQLNEIVKSTRPNPANSNNPIGQLIDLWYPDGVANANSKAHPERVPPGWSSQPAAYRDLVAPYCRACHAASFTSLDFDEHQDFLNNSVSIVNSVCATHRMPQAEVPFKGLWATNGPRLLDVPGVLLSGLTPCFPPAAPAGVPGAPRRRPAAPRDACLEECRLDREACMADVGKPGAFLARQCAEQFTQCEQRRCAAR